MRILKRRRIDKFQVKEQCRLCKSELLVDFDDCNDCKSEIRFICPVCGAPDCLKGENEYRYFLYKMYIKRSTNANNSVEELENANM